MVPSAFQVAPRPLGASHTSEGVPPSTATVFSLPPAKKPSERPSGDQNGKVALSVPVNARACRVFNGLTHKTTAPCACAAAKARLFPSGESAGGPAKSPVSMGECAFLCRNE